MFTNFEDAFFNKRDTEQKIPLEIVNALSESLPNSFEYTQLTADTLVATPKDTSIITFNDNDIELPSKLPKDFKPKSIKDVQEYSYRTQTNLKIKPDDNNCITINDQKLKVTDIIKSPLEDNNDIQEINLYLVPEPFQHPFILKVSNKKVKKELLVQRQPFNDMSKSKFQSINNDSFKFTYIVDEKEGSIQTNFKLQLENAQSVSEAIEALELYYSCIIGEIKLEDISLPRPTEVDSEQSAIQETIKFWRKVLQIEKRLGTNFLPKPEIKVKEALLTEQLYQSLVKKEPFKEYINIKTITLEGEKELDISGMMNRHGLSLQFRENYTFELFDKQINLFGVVGWFDFKITGADQINADHSKYKMFLEPIKGREIYKTLIYFTSQSKASDYIKDPLSLKKLQDASLLSTPYE